MRFPRWRRVNMQQHAELPCRGNIPPVPPRRIRGCQKTWRKIVVSSYFKFDGHTTEFRTAVQPHRGRGQTMGGAASSEAGRSDHSAASARTSACQGLNPSRPTQRSMPSSSPRTGMTGSNSIPAGACGSWASPSIASVPTTSTTISGTPPSSRKSEQAAAIPPRAHQPQQRYSQPGTALPGTRAEGSDPLGEVPASG